MDEVDRNLDDTIKMEGELTVSDTICRLSDVIGSMSRHIDADLIVVDYLQLVRDSSYKDNRVAEIEGIIQTFTNFAREFSVPIVLLSQFSRDYKNDRGEPPQMYHLKGSSGIEQASHYIALLHNPNAKTESHNTVEDDDLHFKATIENPVPPPVKKADDERILFLRKNRNGRIGAVNFVFDKPRSSFKEDSFYG